MIATIHKKSVGNNAFLLSIFIMFYYGYANFMLHKKTPMAFFYSLFFNSSLILERELVNSRILP